MMVLTAAERDELIDRIEHQRDFLNTADENWGVAVDETIAAVIPDGSVVVGRARFERLLEFAQTVQGLIKAEEHVSAGIRTEDTLSYYLAALQPGDLDSLPE